MNKFILSITILLLVGCNQKYRIKNAFEAMDSKQYAIAVDMLKYDFNKTKVEEKKAESAFLLGKSYEMMNEMENAGKWYQRAYKMGYGNQALLGYIKYTIWDERYDEAIGMYKTLQSRSARPSLYRTKILQLKQAQLWKAKDSVDNYLLKNVNLNTEFSEYAAKIIDDRQLLFTSDRPSHQKSETYKWTGKPYADIYISSMMNDEFVAPWNSALNTIDNEGTPAIHKDGNLIVFVRCFSEYLEEDETCKLMATYKNNNEWSIPQMLNFVDEKYNYGSPYWNNEGTNLFFSSNINTGFGGYDLYSVKFGTNGFELPINLGSRINTEGDEKFPSLLIDTLFFSSNQHTGMGGLDIFRSYLRYDSTWGAPQNMLPPINSGGDDFCYEIDTSFVQNDQFVKKAYFSSSRKGGKGGDDIYEYLIKKPIVETIEVEQKERVIHLVVKTNYPIYKDEMQSTPIIIDEKPLSNVEISFDSIIQYSDKKGIMINKLGFDKNYILKFVKENYFTQLLDISTELMKDKYSSQDTTIYYEVLMIPIRKNKEVVIDDIFYDYDKWDLRIDAYPALNKLYEMLKLNPKLIVELSSHTDCRGESDYNQLLSTKRAESVVNYLVKKGIDPSSLKAKGYGYTMPIVDCNCDDCTEEEHQKNRRTSFKILSY